MTEAETIKKMLEIAKRSEDDPEVGHLEADRLLCAFLGKKGYGDLVEAYREVCKWYA